MNGYAEESERVKAGRALRVAARKFVASELLDSLASEPAVRALEEAAIAWAKACAPERRKRATKA